MRVRRLGVPSAALVLAALAVASTGCADQSAAARVGDDTVSEADLLDEVEALADNDQLWDLVTQSGGQPPEVDGELQGSYDRDFVARVLHQRVTAVLVRQLLEREGGRVTDADRQAARQQLDSDYGPSFADFPEWYQDQLLADTSRVVRVQEELGGDAESALVDLAEQVDVELSSRYGSWDTQRFLAAELAVVPPDGPRQPESAGSGPGPATADPATADPATE